MIRRWRDTVRGRPSSEETVTAQNGVSGRSVTPPTDRLFPPHQPTTETVRPVPTVSTPSRADQITWGVRKTGCCGSLGSGRGESSEAPIRVSNRFVKPSCGVKLAPRPRPRTRVSAVTRACTGGLSGETSRRWNRRAAAAHWPKTCGLLPMSNSLSMIRAQSPPVKSNQIIASQSCRHA